MHPVIYLLDGRSGPDITDKDFLPAHWLCEIIELRRKRIEPDSEDPLNIFGQISLYLRIGDRNAITLF